jgi:hypothetical protein
MVTSVSIDIVGSAKVGSDLCIIIADPLRETTDISLKYTQTLCDNPLTVPPRRLLFIRLILIIHSYGILTTRSLKKESETNVATFYAMKPGIYEVWAVIIHPNGYVWESEKRNITIIPSPLIGFEIINCNDPSNICVQDPNNCVVTLENTADPLSAVYIREKCSVANQAERDLMSFNIVDKHGVQIPDLRINGYVITDVEGFEIMVQWSIFL